MQDFLEGAYVGLKLFSILSILLILSACRRQEQPSHLSLLVTYRFDGPADAIYATLVGWRNPLVGLSMQGLAHIGNQIVGVLDADG